MLEPAIGFLQFWLIIGGVIAIIVGIFKLIDWVTKEK